jgi:hypothetical protein
MKLQSNPLLIETLLKPYRQTLGNDFTAYRNHCCRVYNFCLAISGKGVEEEEKIAIAAVFHDIGIWTHKTFDYLESSRRLVRSYLERSGKSAWSDEIEAMIEEHHKITSYKANPAWLVEAFRKADLVDISCGFIRFRLDSAFVREVLDEFPNTGFHKTLIRLTKLRFRSHPFDPLPMMKW